MRVAIFTETFLPKIDGIVNTLCHLLNHLAERGHESILFAPDGGPFRYANTRVISYPGQPFPLYPELKLVPPIVDVRHSLEAFAPDIVHVMGPTSLGVAGIWHASRLGYPIISSYHTDLSGFARQWGLGVFVEAIWSLTRLFYNRSQYNVCPSSAAKADLEKNGVKNVGIWSRGVRTDLFNPAKRSNDMRKKLTSGHPEAPLVIYVGRLSYEKRVDWLLPIAHQQPNVRIALVGDGPARVKLEQDFAGTNTVFTGFLQGEELAAAYAAADIFAFPAANETFGNVLLEAMSSGVPGVAAGAGGPIDIISHEQNGLLFEPNSQKAFCEAIARLAHNHAERIEMGRQARRTAEGRTWEIILDKLLEDYQRTIKRFALRRVA